MIAVYRHLIFRSTLLYVLFSSVGLAQVLPQGDRRIAFQGRNLSIDEYVRNLDALSAFRSKRLKELDPGSLLSRDQHENLWKNNIELRISSVRLKAIDTAGGKNGTATAAKTVNTVSLDRFGMGATVLISDSMPTICAEVTETVNDVVVGVELDFATLDEVLIKIKKTVDQKWARSKPSDYPKVVFRAELVDHFSVIRKKPERWLLIDAYHVDEFEGDLVQADFRNFHLGVRSGKVNSADPRTFLNRALPHPQVEEVMHSMLNPEKLLPNRQDPKVIVHDDRLTLQERERTLGFKVVDKTGRKLHQIEGFTNVDRRSELRLQRAIDEAVLLIYDRIPRGSSLTFEELHLRIGSVANVMGRTLPDCQLVVTVLDKEVGDTNYSMIKIDAQFR